MLPMTRSNWIAGTLIVLVMLGLALTFDPLGLWDDSTTDEGDDVAYDPGMMEAGLKGRGTRPLPGADPASWEGDPVGVLTLGLGSASLRGSVTGDGAPLRFARVQPVLAPPHDGVAVRTTKEGTWEVRGLPAGQFDVRATHPEFVGRTVVSPAVAEDQTADVEPIDLARRTGTTNAIVVKVTDAFGRPIPAANVLATTMRWDIHLAMGPKVAGIRDVLHKSGKTDEQGRVRLGPLQPENYGVVAYAPGYVNHAVENVVVSSGRERHLTIRLAESLSISGRVVDGAGNGVEGAIVMAMAQPSFHSSLTTHSAADGSFVLDGLRKGAQMVIAWEQQGGTIMTPGKAPSQGVELKLQGTGHVVGKVVWADGSGPVTSGQVRPFQTGPFQYVYSQVTPIDADGTFDLHLPKGTWHFRAQADNGQMSDDTKSQATVNVGETTNIEIKVPKTGVVRGVVMDEAGNHVGGAEVYVMKGGFPETPSREQYARTDEDGAFEVPGLPFEPVKLHVVHTEYANAKVDATPQAPDAAKSISVRLTRGARVVGRVADAEGNGIAGEQVNLILTWFDARSTFTGPDGSYAFEAVAEGDYSLSTGPFEQGARGLSKSGIHVGTEGVVTVDFETPVAAGRLTGEVRRGETAIGGAEVRIQDSRGPEAAVVVRTDEGGRFAAEGLEYGRVSVMAKTPDGMSNTVRHDVTKGDTPSHVVVRIGSASLRARVIDENGEPVPGCWINTEIANAGDAGWSRVKHNGNSDSDGRYEAPGLQAGTYIIRVNRVEYAQYVSEPVTVADGESRDLGDVRMTRGVLLTGQVRDDAGAPLEKATVSLKDMQGRPVFLFSMATSGSDGRYSLSGVEPGRYTVTFEAKGHGPDAKEVEIGAGGATADGTLQRGGTLSVSVEDPDGSPLAGVRVKLIDEQGLVVSRTISLVNFDSGKRSTGADGKTELADLAEGTYLVRCELPGYVIVGGAPRIAIKPGETTTARVVLELAP
jgi:protocatechuate 3,4-dioxygenase beta subunit